MEAFAGRLSIRKPGTAGTPSPVRGLITRQESTGTRSSWWPTPITSPGRTPRIVIVEGSGE